MLTQIVVLWMVCEYGLPTWCKTLMVAGISLNAIKFYTKYIKPGKKTDRGFLGGMIMDITYFKTIGGKESTEREIGKSIMGETEFKQSVGV